MHEEAADVESWSGAAEVGGGERGMGGIFGEGETERGASSWEGGERGGG